MEIPLEFKKGNAVRIHQKYNKQNVKNYRPASLLPICHEMRYLNTQFITLYMASFPM